MSNNRPMTTGQPTQETALGMVISLAFWLSLVAATLMFAAVALSPKVLERLRLQGQFGINQFQLVQIEQQNEQLQRVAQAIRHDKEFAAEMTRIELDAIRPDEEIIPVDAGMRLSPRDLSIPHSPPVVAQVWYRPLLVPFAENDSLRKYLLGTAAALVVISFTWFQQGSARRLSRPVGACRSIWLSIRSRYVRST